MKRSRIILLILGGILLLASIVVFLFPVLHTSIKNAEEQQSIQEFQNYVDEQPDDPSAPVTTDTMLFPALYEACVKYNREIAATGQADLSAQTVTLPALCLPDYGYSQETFGYISIPAAEIKSPLYLGASTANMDKGAVILGQTSMPIGGEDTHCVIAGHRSWSGAIMFRGLEQLQPGDTVQITNPWETLTYTVVNVQVIRPNEVEKIKIQPEQDLLSIFTCTYPNTRRVLVTCERTTEENEKEEPCFQENQRY